ncbi:MAG: DinB family protein [Cyclobacteriaceae bacterium]
MTTSESYISNFEEVRRRSIMIWESLPVPHYHSRPDNEAESFIEVIRHVLECERLFHIRIIKRGSVTDYRSPWEGRPLTNLSGELKFAEPYRAEFLDMVSGFSNEEMDNIEIAGNNKTKTRSLSDFLLRAAYHESVHAGQFLANLRVLGIERPYIWD